MFTRKRPQDSGFGTGLPCPTCSRSLVPLSFYHAVTFQCGNGHEWSIQDLVAARSQVLVAGLERLVGEWERQRDNLLAGADDAARKGYLEISQIFHRQTEILQGRIDVMRRALASFSPSSRQSQTA